MVPGAQVSASTARRGGA